MDLSQLNTIPGIAAASGIAGLVALVVSSWGKISEKVSYLSSYAIGAADFNVSDLSFSSTASISDTWRYFRENWKIYSSPTRKYFYTQQEVRKLHAGIALPALAVRGKEVILLSQKSDSPDWGIRMRYIKGTVDVDSLVAELFDFLCRRRETQKFEKNVDKIKYSEPSIVDHIGASGSIDHLFRNKDNNKSDNEVRSTPISSNSTSTRQVNRDLECAPILFEDIPLFEKAPSEESGLLKERMFVRPLYYAVHQEISEWIQDEAWYAGLGIPYHRGYVLSGPPGTGKSTLVRFLAVAFSLPIHRFHLSTLTDKEFSEKFKDICSSGPIPIILIEDIHSVYNGSTPVADKGVSFECLLNCLSGVDASIRYLLFITTNNPKTLDPALAGGGAVSRPGRVDKVLDVGPLTKEEYEPFLRRYFSTCTFLSESRREEEIEALIPKYGQVAPLAVMQNLCIERIVELKRMS